MPRVTTGDLRHRIALQTRVQAAAGGIGGSDLTDSFTTLDTVWATVEGLRGGRYVAGRQVEEIATHRITIRWRADFTSWTHCAEGARRWRIHEVKDIAGDRQWLEILAEEQIP